MTNAKIYVDANILIAIFREQDPGQVERIISYLDNPNHHIITSDFLVLETLPKPSFYDRQKEIEYMKGFVDRAHRHIGGSAMIVKNAISLACKYDLQPLDALHISAAIVAKADEFLTLERPNSPLCRVREIPVVSLYRTVTGT